ncbi:DUF4304 domain-containing protein [Asanoa iriomotensis]|nr:DUF4304 domain-containing protein [Asanoa iriomotensis]
MTAQEFLKRALQDVVGPDARAHGFKGTRPTWRKSNRSGDWAVVNVQSSPYSTSQSLSCVINLAVAPEPWLRWQHEERGNDMPKAVPEYLGLYRERLHPAGTPDGVDGWWEVTDEESAVAVAADMVVQLEAAGWPVLDRLLTAGGMLDQVRCGDLGYMKQANFDVFFARAEALLLMDQGPSDLLEKNLRHAREHCIATQHENAKKFDEWVRAQARGAA